VQRSHEARCVGRRKEGWRWGEDAWGRGREWGPRARLLGRGQMGPTYVKHTHVEHAFPPPGTSELSEPFNNTSTTTSFNRHVHTRGTFLTQGYSGWCKLRSPRATHTRVRLVCATAAARVAQSPTRLYSGAPFMSHVYPRSIRPALP
jgi:hypothetical protein